MFHPDSMRSILSCLILLPLLVAGCPAADADCAETAPTWDDVSTIFSDRCTHCHSSTLEGPDRNGAPAGFNYDSEEGVRAVGAQIMVQLDAGWMPDDDPGSVPAEDVELIRSFVQCE